MSRFKFRQKAMNYRGRKSKLLERMANNAVYEFKVASFDKRSFDGNSWAPNKVQDGRQQLVKTGRLRESITIISRSHDVVKVGTNVPYASYHNRGTKHLPKRQFIGKSRSLDGKNKRLIDNYLRRK